MDSNTPNPQFPLLKGVKYKIVRPHYMKRNTMLDLLRGAAFGCAILGGTIDVRIAVAGVVFALLALELKIKA